jgi:hypothetical protein
VKADLNAPSEEGAPNAGAFVGVGVEEKGDCCAVDGVENDDTDEGEGTSFVWGLGLKKGEEVGVTSLPKAPNPDAGLNTEGVVVRLPNAPPVSGLGPKGEEDGALASVTVPVPKGDVSGEDEGDDGRLNGFVGVFGVSSSLA